MKKINNIRNDITKIINNKSLNSNQLEVVNIIFMANEIFTGEIESVKANNEGTLEVFKKKSDREKKSDEQPDTTHMPKLEGDESAEQEEDKG